MVCAAVPQESHSRGNSVFTVDVAFLQIYNEQARRRPTREPSMQSRCRCGSGTLAGADALEPKECLLST